MPNYTITFYLPDTAMDVKQIIQSVAESLYDGNESMAFRRIVRDFAADRKIEAQPPTPEPNLAPSAA